MHKYTSGFFVVDLLDELYRCFISTGFWSFDNFPRLFGRSFVGSRSVCFVRQS
jgi:hypothetical protein